MAPYVGVRMFSVAYLGACCAMQKFDSLQFSARGSCLMLFEVFFAHFNIDFGPKRLQITLRSPIPPMALADKRIIVSNTFRYHLAPPTTPHASRKQTSQRFPRFLTKLLYGHPKFNVVQNFLNGKLKLYSLFSHTENLMIFSFFQLFYKMGLLCKQLNKGIGIDCGSHRSMVHRGICGL